MRKQNQPAFVPEPISDVDMNRALKKKLILKAKREISKKQGDISELEKLQELTDDKLDAIKSSKLVQMIDQIKLSSLKPLEDSLKSPIFTERTFDGPQLNVGVNSVEEDKKFQKFSNDGSRSQRDEKSKGQLDGIQDFGTLKKTKQDDDKI